MRKVSTPQTRSGLIGILMLGLVACVALAPTTGWAQQVTAAITGKVTDPSGASIAGAKITATDVDRGSAWTAVTNTEGVYNFPQLPVGTYNVKVENPAFRRHSNLTCC